MLKVFYFITGFIYFFILFIDFFAILYIYIYACMYYTLYYYHGVGDYEDLFVQFDKINFMFNRKSESDKRRYSSI